MMRELYDDTEGEVIIDADDATIHGIVVGSVVVTSGRHLVINGSVIGIVTVQPGAHVDLHGVVIGSITSHGGRVNVTGVLEGAMSGESFVIGADAAVFDVTQTIDRGIH